MAVPKVLYPEKFRDMLGVFGRGRAEVYLLFHRRHKELVVWILIDDAHLFEPGAAAARFLFELFVDILRYAPARRFIQPCDKAHERGLSAAVFTEENRSAALRNFKRYIFENAPVFDGKLYIFECK